jgi:hypothetical protein
VARAANTDGSEDLDLDSPLGLSTRPIHYPLTARVSCRLVWKSECAPFVLELAHWLYWLRLCLSWPIGYIGSVCA